MPRWRSLPEELDPQIREFASQLRRLVDRSGLSVATIADRTGYSKSSWERYLNGRLLPPRGATQALAEVTGTDVRHLGTMWELAERAWSRAEMRHDTTLEAIQIAQARAALNDPAQAPGKGRKRRKSKSASEDSTPGDGAPQGDGAPHSDISSSGTPHSGAPHGGVTLPPEPDAPQQSSAQYNSAQHNSGQHNSAQHNSGQHNTAQHNSGQHSSAQPGVPQRQDMETTVLRKDDIRAVADTRSATDAQGDKARMRRRRHQSDSTDWDAATAGPGAAGRTAAGQAPSTRDSRATNAAFSPSASGPQPSSPQLSGPQSAPGAPSSSGETAASDALSAASEAAAPVPETADSEQPGKRGKGRRLVTVLLVSLVVVLVAGAGTVLFFDFGGDGKEDAAQPKSSPARTDTQKLPAGVKCSGKECSGKDPEAMGCGGRHVQTSSSASVGRSFVEVRYSKVCKASWARITRAKTGDAVRITGPDGQSESDKVRTTNDAYTKMVSVGTQDEARACATLTAGGKGCTVPGKKAAR